VKQKALWRMLPTLVVAEKKSKAYYFDVRSSNKANKVNT
jgi:hypothetical protein